MKLVIFDFDGVLVDTFSLSFSLSAECNENLSVEDFRSFFGGNIFNTKRSDGSPVKYRDDFFEKYEAETRELKVPQKLKNTLQHLSKNYTMVIVSSTPTILIKNILDRENAASYFKDILGKDLHKSKVVKIKMVLEKYKILPENAVYVTDTVGDILEARECEVKSIAVTWGYQEEKTLQKAKPDKIVGNPEDLVKAVKEIL